jgi:hypothetical protein
VDTYDDCIDTHGIVSKLEVPLEFLDLNNNRTLVGVIELNREDIIVVVGALQGSLGITYVAYFKL